MVAIRGAICVQNNIASISSQSIKLVENIMIANSIDADNIVSIIFSATADINAYNPSTAVRQSYGWNNIPFFSVQELQCVGSLPNCIRVLIFVNQNIDKDNIQHCYLDGAENLRSDLTK